MTYLQELTQNTVVVLESWGVLKQMISSLVLIVGFFALRWGLIVSIRRWHAPSGEEKRRWIIQVKNITVIILAAGLFGIWATELRAFALSLVAVAAALAIATKEMIQCFLGGIYKTSVKPFEIGDRIEINDLRGEVIDHDFLSTTLLEIGPQEGHHALSGRQLVIPNSLFLSHGIRNQSLHQDYALQTIRFKMRPGEDWKATEKLLLDSANRECLEFLEPASNAMSRLAQREGLDLPRVEPRVIIQYDELGELNLILRFPAPVDRVSRVEQAILRSVASVRS